MYQKIKSANTYSEHTPVEYEQVLQLNPNHVLALWEAGRFYDGEYDYAGGGSYWDEFYCANPEKAFNCFKKIIELDPKFSEAYLRLGRIYSSSNKEKSLEYYL